MTNQLRNNRNIYNISNIKNTLKIICVATLCLCCLITLAQKRLVKGYVLDSATHKPLTNAIITNENLRKIVFANNEGFFSITASRNEFISFDAFNYKFDTLMVNRTLPDTITIYLAPETATLPGVTVTAKGYSQYQIDSMQRRMSFVSDVGAKKPEVSTANSGAGIGINLDAIFGKKDRQRRRAYKNFDEQERQAYIDYRFSPAIVMQYTGFKGDTLAAFMRRYTPSYEWLRNHPSNEDIVYYINDKLKLFAHKK